MSDTSSLTPYILFIVEQNSCVYAIGCTICHGSHVCMPYGVAGGGTGGALGGASVQKHVYPPLLHTNCALATDVDHHIQSPGSSVPAESAMSSRAHTPSGPLYSGWFGKVTKYCALGSPYVSLISVHCSTVIRKLSPSMRSCVH